MHFHPIISSMIFSCSSCLMQNGVSVRVPVWEIAIALQPALHTSPKGHFAHLPVSCADLFMSRPPSIHESAAGALNVHP